MARIISAAVMLPIAVLAVIYATPLLYIVGIGIIGTACLFEYFRLIRAMDIQVRPLFGYLAYWVILFALRQDRYPTSTVLAIVMLAAFLSAMWRVRLPMRQRALSLITELFGVFYLTLFLYPAVQIRFDFGEETGLHWTLLLLMVIWAGDTIALVVGKRFGRTPFAAVLSPKKTNEGAMAGLLAGLGVGAAAQYFLFPNLPMRHVMITSVLLGLAGQLGDLAESMLKRAAEIKDSSQLIPGHGGVLDRMDSLLFAFPVLYLYLLQLYS